MMNHDNVAFTTEAIQFAPPAAYSGQKRIRIRLASSMASAPVEIRKEKGAKGWYLYQPGASGRNENGTFWTISGRQLSFLLPLQQVKAAAVTLLAGRTFDQVLEYIDQVAGPRQRMEV